MEKGLLIELLTAMGWPAWQPLIKNKKMYKKNKRIATSIHQNTSIEGETIEQKIERIVNNKEPISDGAPIIYQERSEGVNPAYDIRTDRFEIAVEAMDKVSGTHKAKREERAKAKEEAKGKKDGGTEPIQGTNEPVN